MFTAAAPSLVRVAACVMLDPTATLPRLSVAGVKPSARVSPVPVSEIVCVGLPGAVVLECHRTVLGSRLGGRESDRDRAVLARASVAGQV